MRSPTTKDISPLEMDGSLISGCTHGHPWEEAEELDETKVAEAVQQAKKKQLLGRALASLKNGTTRICGFP